jgi:tetratricopeptide (TPR) repeat protein
MYNFDLVEIPEELICPITQQLMEDPVFTADGHTYERSAIQQWINTGHLNSPMTNLLLSHTTLTSNHILKSIIEEFKEKLPDLQKKNQEDKGQKKYLEGRIKLLEKENKRRLKKEQMKKDEEFARKLQAEENTDNFQFISPDTEIDLLKKQAETNYNLAKKAQSKGKVEETIGCLYLAKGNYEKLKRSGIKCDEILKEINRDLQEFTKSLGTLNTEEKTTFDYNPKEKSPTATMFDDMKTFFNKKQNKNPNNLRGSNFGKDKKDVAALYNKGVELYNLGKYHEAIKWYDKALAINPKYVSALNNKGSALYNLGKYHEAIKCYDKALAINPKDVDALNNKGAALCNLGKYHEAIKCYDKALAINPKDVDALNNKGVSLRKLGKYHEAIKCYDKALAINPKHVSALNNKNIALNKLKEQKQKSICGCSMM